MLLHVCVILFLKGKHLNTYFSPKELSQVIEASESTIKRWVDKGIILADISEGKHRKISLQEVIRFIRLKQQRILRADILGFPDVDALGNDPVGEEVNASQYFNYLIQGDAQKARGYLLKLYLQGISIAAICDQVVAASMNQIGELWMHDKDGICKEHHATDICIQSVNALRMIFHSKDKSKLALGGAPEGDPYFIPSLCVSTVLMSEGYQTVNLGPQTPFESIVRAVDQYRPSVIWLCISSKKLPRQFNKQFDLFLSEMGIKNIQVLIGGIESYKCQHMENQKVFFGKNMSELSAFIKGIKMY